VVVPGVGMEAGLTKQDAIVTSYRDHCTHIGRGRAWRIVLATLIQRTLNPRLLSQTAPYNVASNIRQALLSNALGTLVC